MLQAEKVERGNLLELFHKLKVKPDGIYLADEDIRKAAELSGLPVSFVEGVATFYKLLGKRQRGKYVIRVCESPVCYIKGAESVLEALKKDLGIDVGDTTADGLFTLETVQCIGQCDKAPAMLINDTVYGELTEERIRAILAELRRTG